MYYLALSSSSVLEKLDWVVLSVYFLALIAVAVWVVLQKNKNTEDYFLAGRNVGWFVIGASIFASNIGSEHVVGLAGTGRSGVVDDLVRHRQAPLYQHWHAGICGDDATGAEL